MPVPPLQQRLASDVADRYAVEREVARGGMAVVYLAHDLKHDRPVALKLLNPVAGPAAGDQRFHREIALLARLQHPHILSLHDSGEAAGSLYYVMPFVEGETLRQRLAREGPLPAADALRIAIELADALAYAHARRVVHRDIKPENVLLSGYPPPPGGRTGSWHTLLCDFGIARLLRRDSGPSGDGSGEDSFGGERHTRSGHAIGTPVYMSPEQASGERTQDGRTDVWALGVVLYEMLTGRVPYHDARSQAEAMRLRLTAPPPRLAPDRPPAVSRAVRRRLDAVLARSVHPDPARRFVTAAELSAALQDCLAALRGRAGAPFGLRPRVLALAVAALVVAALLAGVLLARRAARAGGAALDPARVVVLPFRDEGVGEGGPGRDSFAAAQANADAALDGRDAEQLLLDAFARWTDLPVVSATRVNDALARRDVPAPRQLAEALQIARELGAGQLVWGSVQRVPRADPRGGVMVRAALYDVAHPDATLREHRVAVRPALTDVGRAFGELSDSLLLGRARSRGAVAGALATTSWEAWRAYDRGHDALARWDLPTAGRAFAAAAARDPDYALAHLWRAQTLAWLPDAPRAEWQASAARAAALAGRLPAQAQLSAQALAAMAEGRYPDACARYRRLVERDSLDYVAWYGLGDCQARDSVVVRDARSPSGWAFRASYHGAQLAYQRVLSNLPSVHLAFGGAAVTQLPSLLSASGNQLRLGHAAADGDTLRFAAFPSLAGDTLAYVPRRLEDIARVRPGTVPASAGAARERNGRVLLDVARRWATAFPNSASVAEVLAAAQETGGELSGAAEHEGALGSLRRARGLAGGDGARQLVLAVAQLRVLLKLGRFEPARALADSLLAAPRQLAPDDAGRLAAVAALTGRVARAVALTRQAARDAPGAGPPDALREASDVLVAYAALGGPRDSLLAARDRVTRLVAALPADARDAARAAHLNLAMGLAFPWLGAEALAGVPTTGDYLLELQALAARGDRAAVRDRLRALGEGRRGLRAGDLSLDAVLLEASLHAWAGDTAGAAGLLDAALDGLPTQSTLMLDMLAPAAALPRVMALRVALGDGAARAAGAADGATARWRAALDALWSQADPALRRAAAAR